ncbi:TSUP family transporter [Maridesulfovibrio hydrothermalis]|uniref:Probable membrane transporter protein n=1 Tax=Maridesulfovibrio hydrothermalis AM13 = DSM 14728 TaxID=1121451 RepID=L0RGE9_9BACT|nr:TSUP family transporter [Maridesulfovibrio hydrothermalis]CCO25307.1 conserved membrane protein of unknown function [Maridesulfovibrio hydrothermalis AM13 = DSM 14728]
MKYPSARYLLILLFAALPLLIPELLSANSNIKLPDIIGNINNPYILPDGGGPGFFLSAAIGMVAGLLSSAIGAGGGLIVVPALMTAGISGIYAIGSEIFRLFIFSTIQSIRMGFNKRINYLMAIYLTIGTTIGGYGGYVLTKTVFFADPAGSDVFISSMIIFWLIIYSFIIIPEFREAAHEYALELLKKEKGEKEADAAIQMEQPTPPATETGTENKNTNGEKENTAEETEETKVEEALPKAQFEDELYPDEKPWEIAKTIRTMKLPPYIKFPGTIKSGEDDELEPADIRRAGRNQDLDTQEEEQKYDRIPIIPAVLLSVVGGFFMAMTGSGGVILSFTILTKGFGCVAALVAGTDLARLALASGTLTLGAFGLNGFINIYCITGLIFGTTTGLHLGSKSLKHIQPYRVKGLISLLVISVILNRILALPQQLNKSGASIPAGITDALGQSGMYILIIGAAIFSGWLIFAFISGVLESLKPAEKGAGK